MMFDRGGRMVRAAVAATFMMFVHTGWAEPAPPGAINAMPIAAGDGSYVAAEFGQVIVPENRGIDGGGNIAVGFVRVRSSNSDPAEPIFFLPGGPGMSVFGMIDLMLPLMQRIASIGDVVFVEQRGNAAGSPHLRCGETQVGSDGMAPLAGTVQQCRDVWMDAGVDLDAYNIVEAAADVDDVRRFLGYEKVTLAGVSFGSQWALVTIREYPNSVARAFLGGVEGLDQAYDLPSDVLAALRRIAEYAERDGRLAKHVPDIGLISALVQAIERLERQPARYFDAELGREVEITADDVRAIARRDLSDRAGVAAWPEKILRIHNGDFAPAAAEKRRTGQWPLSPAFFYAIDCASGLSDERARRIAQDPAASILGRVNYFLDDDCPVWNVADLGPEFRAPYRSDVPVLIVQGDWDAATPIENLAEVTPMFSDVAVVTANRGTHLAAFHAMENPAIAEHIMRFFATGETDGIPESFDSWAPEFGALDTDGK